MNVMNADAVGTKSGCAGDQILATTSSKELQFEIQDRWEGLSIRNNNRWLMFPLVCQVENIWRQNERIEMN
jgi:hypothetical protein